MCFLRKIACLGCLPDFGRSSLLNMFITGNDFYFLAKTKKGWWHNATTPEQYNGMDSYNRRLINRDFLCNLSLRF